MIETTNTPKTEMKTATTILAAASLLSWAGERQAGAGRRFLARHETTPTNVHGHRALREPSHGLAHGQANEIGQRAAE